MVNVFGEHGAGSSTIPVDIKVLKKVTITEGYYRDYIKQIQDSYKLGATPYRLHTNRYGTWVTPLRVYNNAVYVLDNVAHMPVTDRKIETDDTRSVLIYWIEANDDDDADSRVTAMVGPQGPPGGEGRRGPQGKRGSDGPAGVIGPEGKRGASGAAGPAGIQGHAGPHGIQGERGIPGPQGARGARGPAGSSTVSNAASRSFVIDMVERPTSLDCVFISSLKADIAVSDKGLAIVNWETIKSADRVVQTRPLSGEFIISQPSSCATYLHCIAENKTQENVLFELYSRTKAQVVDSATLNLQKGELYSILLHHRVDATESLSVRVFGTDLDFVIRSAGSRFEVTETHRWEAPELIITNHVYPWPLETDVTIANNIEEYQHLHILAKHDDNFIHTVISPVGLMSLGDRGSSTWKISVEGKLDLEFSGDGHQTLKMSSKEHFRIYYVSGVRC